MSELTRDIFFMIQRQMAWERAKGELQSMLIPYTSDYPKHHPKYDDKYDKAEKAISDFITYIEDEGLSE